LVHRKRPWGNVEHVEGATLNYVDWFNNRRIHESLDYVSSALRTLRGGDHSQSSFGGEEEVVAVTFVRFKVISFAPLIPGINEDESIQPVVDLVHNLVTSLQSIHQPALVGFR
jgi:hypothetical protein